MTSLTLNLAPNPFVALEIMFWLMGSLADRSFEHVWLATPFMVLGWILLFLLARALDALTLGEDAAQTIKGSVGGAALAHPAFKKFAKSRLAITISDPHWVCGTPFVLDAVDHLVAVRKRWQDQQRLVNTTP